MSTITNLISFLINTLASLLTSDLIFPFVGIWAAAYVIYLFIRLMKGGYKQ